MLATEEVSGEGQVEMQLWYQVIIKTSEAKFFHAHRSSLNIDDDKQSNIK